MLRSEIRHCDVCYRKIGRGDRYIHRKILMGDLPRVLKAVDDILTVDAHGNIEMDICLDCASITGVSGEKVVN